MAGERSDSSNNTSVFQGSWHNSSANNHYLTNIVLVLHKGARKALIDCTRERHHVLHRGNFHIRVIKVRRNIKFLLLPDRVTVRVRAKKARLPLDKPHSILSRAPSH